MLYCIIGEDRENSLKARLQHRPAHLQRLQELLAQGGLVVAGPLPAIDSEDPGPAGYQGSVIIAEFGSIEEAEDWAEQDPYLTGGVYDRIMVRPFKQVLPPK